MTSDLHCHAAQDQRPQQHHDGEIKAGQRDGQRYREGDEQDATEGHQPHLVPTPVRTETGDHQASLGIVARDQVVNDASADVPAVEHGEDREHEAQDGEPGLKHGGPHSRQSQ